MAHIKSSGRVACVAPFAGAWIEIRELAVREQEYRVAPFAGAWIEIALSARIISSCTVAPFAGAWIEMQGALRNSIRYPSLPSRERGLKSSYACAQMRGYSRSLRGSVD